MPRRLLTGLLLILALSSCDPATGAGDVPAARPDSRSPVLFVEPLTAGAGDGGEVFMPVRDPGRLDTLASWLDNEAADLARRLHARAVRAARAIRGSTEQPDTIIVALVPGGNHAAIGLSLELEDGLRELTRVAYVRLEPRQWRFEITLLHETGHVILAVLNGGAEIPRRPIASFSHGTAALTDRGTAFDEGFATHLETLVVHLSEDPDFANRYRNHQLLFGEWPGLLAEYYHPSADLWTFSQTRARYAAVRDGWFAFQTAIDEPHYLRTQLETGRDFSRVRSPDQLLQSEGFYATLFFSWAARGKARPDRDTVLEREARMFRALAASLAEGAADSETPHLVEFARAFATDLPGDWPELADLILDLSRGVFLDPMAADLWRSHYLGALRLDAAALDLEGTERVRAAWRRHLIEDPGRLATRLGPQIRCEIPSVPVVLPELELDVPTSFDANTAQPAVLRLIPGMGEPLLARWLREREERPFASAEELAGRLGIESTAELGATCG